MFKNIQAIFLSTLLALSFLIFATPTIAHAQASGGGAGAFLCIPSDGGGNGQDLYGCINKLYKFTLAIGAIGAVAMIVVAGYLYMSGGNEQISQAKSMIGTSIWGIVIFIASYGFLRMINPALVEFRSIRPPAVKNVTLLTPEERDKAYCVNFPNLCKDGAPIGGTPTDPGNPTSGGVSKDHPETSCATSASNCVDLKAYGVTCKNSCKAQKNIAEKIGQFAAKMKPVKVIITEGYPPTSNHKDGCHATGACVDLSVDPRNDANWGKACQAAQSVSGMNYLNEISTSVASTCGKYISGGTGQHMHAFLTQ